MEKEIYICVSPYQKSIPLIWGASYYRKDCEKRTLDWDGGKITWKELYKEGYRIKKAKLIIK